jgi:hypothetical protein
MQCRLIDPALDILTIAHDGYQTCCFELLYVVRQCRRGYAEVFSQIPNAFLHTIFERGASGAGGAA